MKTRSGLVRLLADGHEDEDEIRAAMAESGIELTEDETAEIEGLKETRSFFNR